MAKYLDENGLKYLWTKIEDKIDEMIDDNVGHLTVETLKISLSTNQGGGGNDYGHSNSKWDSHHI